MQDHAAPVTIGELINALCDSYGALYDDPALASVAVEATLNDLLTVDVPRRSQRGRSQRGRPQRGRSQQRGQTRQRERHSAYRAQHIR